MKTARFVNEEQKVFFSTLRKRVNDYFKEAEVSKHANTPMVMKTITILLLYVGSYALVVSDFFTKTQLIFVCAFMGVLVAGIGMSIMHDANHGSYSKHPHVNKMIALCINLVGACSFNWKTQHNIKHHSFTNIPEYDDDINQGGALRLSPHQDRKWFHRYQHLYAIPLYGLLTLSWMTIKDFIQLVQYKKEGYLKLQKTTFAKELTIVILTKTWYYAMILVVPYLVLDITIWQWLLGFFTIHFTAGLILSIVFQLAHIVEESSQPIVNEKGIVENEWAVHQLKTTVDFSHKNPLISWYVGGLNYQIEHHLFPNICHIHYSKLADIVKETAEEFNIQYHRLSLWKAVSSHFSTLRKLGKGESVMM